jgi:hypothetical protein
MMPEVKEQRSLINLCLDLVELDPSEQENKAFIMQRLGQLADKVDNYVAMDLFADQQIDGLKAEIGKLQALVKRYEDVKESLRDRAMVALQTLNQKKLKSDKGHELSIRVSESIDVFDITRLPDWAVKTTISKQADKTAIKVAIKDGDKVDGARLVKKEYVVMR